MNTPLLSRPVSLFAGTSPRVIRHGTAGEVLEEIRSGKWRDHVEAVRAMEQGGARKAKKDSSRGYTFAGSFSRRENERLIEPSGLVCLDYDHLPDVDAVLARLRPVPYVFAAWRSISGDGIKLLVSVTPAPETPNEYTAAWRRAVGALAAYVGAPVDAGTKDVSRLSYTSYDPTLYVNPAALPLDVSEPSPPLPPQSPVAPPRSGAHAFPFRSVAHRGRACDAEGDTGPAPA